jgi:hypothetical protein
MRGFFMSTRLKSGQKLPITWQQMRQQQAQQRQMRQQQEPKLQQQEQQRVQ